MLLGNNIMKPLGAEITLFSTGNGILRIKEEEIDLKETTGGHYTVQVSDLGKFCNNSSSMYTDKQYYPCDMCANLFRSIESLEMHKVKQHRNKDVVLECRTSPKDIKMKSALKKERKELHEPENSTRKVLEDLKGDNNYNQIVTDLNTLKNAKVSKRERSLIQIVEKLAKLTLEELKQKCDICGKECTNMTTLNSHEGDHHEGQNVQQTDENKYDVCDKEFTNRATLKNHNDEQHQAQIQEIFLSHHEAATDEELIELGPTFWNILNAEKDENFLTEDEEKEILKLHKYFVGEPTPTRWKAKRKLNGPGSILPVPLSQLLQRVKPN